MRNVVRMFLVAAAAASQAWAGVVFTQVTKVEGGRGAEAANAVVKTSVDGGRARVEWEDSNNPMIPKGAYMLINEKGEMLLVNPDKRTYSKFDLAAMSEGASQAMSAVANMGFSMEITDPKVEKTAEESGGEMLGFPTTHYRWHTSYTTVMHMPKPLKDRVMPSESMEDVWTTTAVEMPAVAVKALSGISGGPAMKELSKVAELEKSKMTGFALKRVIVSSGSGRGGSQKTTITTVVQDLKKASIPASTFVIPADYTETDLMQSQQRGPAMPNLNQQ